MTDLTSPPPKRRWRPSLTWLGLLPFALFIALFLVMPTMKIVIGAFQRADGSFTFENIAGLFTASILSSYWISIKISVASSAIGCLIGFLMAAGMVLGGCRAASAHR